MKDARPALAIAALGLALVVVSAMAWAGDAGVPAVPVATGAEVTADDLRARVRYLASDELSGRMSTEPGGLLASAYVAREFQRIGLKPLGDGGDWFQGFEIAQVELQEGNRLEAEVCEVGAMGDVGADGEGEKRAFTIEKDWNPFSVSPNAEAAGPLVFAGYGVANPDRAYDDFAGVDVEGKVLLVFRKEPAVGAGRATRHATFLAKLAQAATRKAAALLLVNDERTAADGDRIFHWSVPIGPPAGSAKIPFAFVTRETAAALLAPLLAGRPEGERNLAALQASIDRAPGGARPASAAVPGVRVRIRAALGRATGKNARNVVGFLPGADPDPKVRDEVVVVGAHHDHVGSGWFASAGGSAAAGKIHPGADDNASGTAALLEIAENLAAAKERPRRSVLFLSFSGEELGLLGSAHYVEHPVLPLDRVVTMVNCDMVGAYDADRKLEIGGVGTGAGLQDLVDGANRPYGLSLAWDPQGVAPSDNTSFFRKRVPVLFFFTGVHDRYHTPADTWDKLNYSDGEKVARLCRDVVVRLRDADARVAFTKPPPRAGENRAVLGIGLGEPSDAPGVTVGEVAEGGPAAEAGLEAGDVITSIDLTPTRTPQDLLRVLASHAPGDSVRVTVLRGDDSKVLTVKLGSR